MEGGTVGDRYEYVNSYENLAKDGYLVVSIEYPLSTMKNHLWSKQETEAAKGLLWIKNNANKYHIDLNRVGLTGTSAGGNMAINIATKTNDGTFNKILGQSLPKIKAVSVVVPAVNPAYLWNHVDISLRGMYREMGQKHFGGLPKDVPEAYDAINSTKIVNSSTPPILWAYGGSNHLVVPGGNGPTLNKLKTIGTKKKIIKLSYSDHTGVNMSSLSDQIYQGATLSWFDKYVK
ncbi:TPA: alpha/beta hydrolase [Staphylococcus aureus]|nr:alpha/beta hydrolase [Staphylococcus aureus]